MRTGASAARSAPHSTVNLGLEGNATAVAPTKNGSIAHINGTDDKNHTKPFKLDIDPKEIANLLKVT